MYINIKKFLCKIYNLEVKNIILNNIDRKK